MTDENVRLLAFNEISEKNKNLLNFRRSPEQQESVNNSLKTLREWACSQPWGAGRLENRPRMPEFEKK